ncbi:CRISPR-associated Cse2 family protein [Leucobacter luti]|uniref:CRISPR-associated Cse2 family protein n=1 Tax=Leucobacter luti TaxID=340320 RepID=A0A4R6RZJ9_9MICO|nr:type I-E CRISPR-associated protein Cse2/CasB [Leucobacter luti]TDP92580.1 CRISPR-associated Cse2 family protein [Leucobacter luti]
MNQVTEVKDGLVQSHEWRSLRAHVDATVTRLQAGYAADRSWAVAALARLRNGVGGRPGDDPLLVEFTTANLYPEGVSLPDAPTAREHAAYAAITLFAMHQQSKHAKSMHKRDVSLGKAARALPGRETSEGVERRVTAVVKSASWEATVTNARGLVQLLRAAEIPLDYGQLAEDLLRLQDPNRAHWVRNRWGRDLYLSRPVAENGDTGAAPGADTSLTSDSDN